MNQVIIKEDGLKTWLGFWSNSEKINKALDQITDILKSDMVENNTSNRFWVLDSEGGCVAAQSSLEGAKIYYNYNPNDRVIVHGEPDFY